MSLPGSSLRAPALWSHLIMASTTQENPAPGQFPRSFYSLWVLTDQSQAAYQERKKNTSCAQVVNFSFHDDLFLRLSAEPEGDLTVPQRWQWLK